MMPTTSGVKGSVYIRTDATTYTKIIDTTAWTVNVAEQTVDTQLHNTDYFTRVKGPVAWTATVEGLAQTTRSNTNFASLMVPESATTGGSTAATVTKHPIVSSDFALSRYRSDLQGYYASEAAGTADNTSASNDDWFYVIGAEEVYVYHSGAWAQHNNWQSTYLRDGAVWIGEQDDAGILSYFSSNTYSASTRYYTYHTDDGLFRRVELTGTTTNQYTWVDMTDADVDGGNWLGEVADETARVALSPSNGDLCYQLDTNALWHYGTVWDTVTSHYEEYFVNHLGSEDDEQWLGSRSIAELDTYFETNTFSTTISTYVFREDINQVQRLTAVTEVTGSVTGTTTTVVPGSTLYIRFRNLSGTSPVYEGQAILSEVTATTPADGLATISASMLGTGAIIYKEA